MKTYVTFFIVVVALSDAIRNEEQLKEVTGFIRKCQEEYGLSNEFLDEIGSKHETDTQKAGQFSLCFTKKVGILKSTGEIDESKIKDFFRIFKAEDQMIQKILSKCKVPVHSTPEESALTFIQCLEGVYLK
uniref:Odorant-binding protein n=1 Tax=Galeruca daurica TaxID=1651263 RepID=A0A1U9W516_9CUCU|nr:odorant-binding protein [Galeruca daurica]